MCAQKKQVFFFFFTLLISNQGCCIYRLSMNDRVKVLTSLRLDMNKPYIQKWPEVTMNNEKVKLMGLCILTRD